MTEKVNSYHEW